MARKSGNYGVNVQTPPSLVNNLKSSVDGLLVVDNGKQFVCAMQQLAKEMQAEIDDSGKSPDWAL